MTDPCAELQDIQDRADKATGCPTAETDIPRLVAALRAVLEICDDVELDANGCYGARPPKLTPPAALVPRLRGAITEALSGRRCEP